MLKSMFTTCKVLQVLRHGTHACRLQDSDAELLVSMFKDFWDAQNKTAAGNGSATEAPNGTTAVRPSEPPPGSSAGAQEPPSTDAIKDAAADGSQKAAEDERVNGQAEGQAAVVAADMGEGVSSMMPHPQGSCSAALISAHRISAVSSITWKVSPRCMLFHACYFRAFLLSASMTERLALQ